ncbi:MAG: hypothetical protein ABIO76_08780 [Ginsengibacter sp.]
MKILVSGYILCFFRNYRINEGKDAVPGLRFVFKKGELNFYACSIEFIEGNLDNVYDWTSGVMNDNWDTNAAKQKIKKNAGRACV